MFQMALTKDISDEPLNNNLQIYLFAKLIHQNSKELYNCTRFEHFYNSWPLLTQSKWFYKNLKYRFFVEKHIAEIVNNVDLDR